MMNIKLKYIILLCIGFVSCRTQQLKADVELLKSRSINLLNFDSLSFHKNLDKPIDTKNADFKMIIYIDSTECSSCLIKQMYLWNKMIDYSNAVKSKIIFYFIIAPKNGDAYSVKKNLIAGELRYPVLIDEKGDFERLNPHLPKNKVLHTFLLDENNKVILVGNPLHNKEIEKLFYKRTQELLSK